MEPRYSSTVVCVGVGVSGIALGAHLKLKYGFDDIRFYEREAAIGGTWLLNSYPGMSPHPGLHCPAGGRGRHGWLAGWLAGGRAGWRAGWRANGLTGQRD